MLEHWYRALRSEHGIVLRTEDFDHARQQLYKARAASMDPDLDDLSVCQSPTDSNELWIVKRPKQ